VGASPELRRALANPVISPDSKRRVVRSLLERRAPDPRSLRFVDLLAERDRLVLIGEIASAVERELNRREGVHEVRLASAIPLDEALKTRIVAALRSVTGGTVRVTETIDPALLGGVVARVGETLYDASLKTRLDHVRERMIGDGSGAAG
jgi:F-type H+-transporting ATPase subunit delta